MNYFTSLLAEKTVFPARRRGTWEGGAHQEESDLLPDPDGNRGSSASDGRKCGENQSHPQRSLQCKHLQLVQTLIPRNA